MLAGNLASIGVGAIISTLASIIVSAAHTVLPFLFLLTPFANSGLTTSTLRLLARSTSL